jgi:hypothetical protein
MLSRTYVRFVGELNNDWIYMESDMTDEQPLRREQLSSLASRRS